MGSRTAIDKTGERFVFIDALRGIACIAVVFHHLLLDLWNYGVYPQGSMILDWIENRGRLGVEIFFVISGFVIAHSLRNFDGSFSSVVRFAIRRQLRLDPPYWVALVGVTAMLIAQKVFMPAMALPFPGVKTYLANLLYLHGILGQRELLNVAWTLCIEIQFYLLYILFLLLAFRFAWRDRTTFFVGAAAIGAFVSMWATLQAPTQVWAAPYWHYFVGGVVAYWTWVKGISPVWLGLLLLSAIARFVHEPSGMVLVGWGTVAGVFAVASAGKLTRWTLGPVTQYFGRISYSLYLVHRLVIMNAMWVAGRAHIHGVAPAIVACLVMLALCVLAAHLLWAFVELPSMRLASQFGKRRVTAAADLVVAPGAAASTFGDGNQNLIGEVASLASLDNPPPAP